jgi:hypothetical protein
MWRFGVRAVGVWVAAVGSLILVPSTAPVAAEPVDMAPQYYSKQTRDGWQLSISIEGERINSVPNLAAATNSREGFVTLAATATAVGGATPITVGGFRRGDGGFRLIYLRDRQTCREPLTTKQKVSSAPLSTSDAATYGAADH